MPIVEIHLLGTFEIYVDNQLVSHPLARSKKLRHLVEFLILNRNRAVPNEEVMEALWPTRKNKDPRNALKLLIHRLRAGLIEGGAPEDLDFLITRQCTCRWNPEIYCIYDFEKFDALCTVRMNDKGNEDVLYIRLGSACDLYQGKLMADASGELWQQEISDRMHKNFLDAANCLIEMMDKRRMHEEILKLCRRILYIEPGKEEIHQAYILALAQAGHNQMAIEHYLEITRQVYDKKGIQPPEKLRRLYQQIVETERKSSADIDLICEELREKEEIPGAFVCSYDVFREVYRLEARSMARYDTCAAIALLTISDVYQKEPDPKLIAKAMTQFLECVRMSLRRGDMIARYSATQVVIMLPTATTEMGEAVCERVKRNFKREYPKTKVIISHSLRPIESVESSLMMLQRRHV